MASYLNNVLEREQRTELRQRVAAAWRANTRVCSRAWLHLEVAARLRDFWSIFRALRLPAGGDSGLLSFSNHSTPQTRTMAAVAISNAEIEKVLADGFLASSLKREELIARLKVRPDLCRNRSLVFRVFHGFAPIRPRSERPAPSPLRLLFRLFYHSFFA